MMAKNDVNAELLGWPLAFRWPFEPSGIGSKVLEVIDLPGVFELIPNHIHKLKYEGQWA
jgi:hypothetical protein